MKKLNRKGFTLVELLAVIVILAIVIGISIPSVTSIINNSKNSALGVAVESAADHLSDQYDLYLLGEFSAGSLIDRLVAENDELTLTDADDLEELGFKTKNVSEVKAKVIHDADTQKASICVTVTKVSKTGDYYTTAHWDPTGESAKTTAENKAGNGCE